MENLPVAEIAKGLTLSDIIALAMTNKNFLNKLLDPEVNHFYATYYGFPYGLSLKELKAYESLKLETRLERAVKIGDARIIEYLLDQKKFQGFFFTLVDIINTGNVDIIMLFIKHGYYNCYNLLDQTAKTGKKEIFTFIVEKVIEIEKTGYYPLREPIRDLFTDYAGIAASNRQLNIVEYLNKLGYVDPEFILEKASGSEVTQWAINHGAKNYNKKLLKAIVKQNLPVTKILLDAGANNFDEAIRTARGDMRIIKMINDHRR